MNLNIYILNIPQNIFLKFELLNADLLLEVLIGYYKT